MKISTRVRVASFRPATVLKIEGEDSLSFLQGQFTQDLKRGGDGAAAYGLWLNQKGKVLADSVVLRAAGSVCWVVSMRSPAALIRERLESYLIADDVVIEDRTADWAGVFVTGEGAGEWLAARAGGLPPAGRFRESDDSLIWRGRRDAGESWEWLFPAAREGGLDLSGAEALSPEEAERLRIEAGIPAVPQDVGGGDLPNEAGLETDAISYTKGCYLGQEVMARLKAMGQVRRRLLRVSGAATVPEALPASLFFGDKRVGEIRSAVGTEGGWIGLAMVLLTGLPPDARLSLAAGGPAMVQREVLNHD